MLAKWQVFYTLLLHKILRPAVAERTNQSTSEVEVPHKADKIKAAAPKSSSDIRIKKKARLNSDSLDREEQRESVGPKVVLEVEREEGEADEEKMDVDEEELVLKKKKKKKCVTLKREKKSNNKKKSVMDEDDTDHENDHEIATDDVVNDSDVSDVEEVDEVEQDLDVDRKVSSKKRKRSAISKSELQPPSEEKPAGGGGAESDLSGELQWTPISFEGLSAEETSKVRDALAVASNGKYSAAAAAEEAEEITLPAPPSYDDFLTILQRDDETVEDELMLKCLNYFSEKIDVDQCFAKTVSVNSNKIYINMPWDPIPSYIYRYFDT